MMTTLSLALAPMAHAAGQSAPPALHAKFEQAAQKTCNDDLDKDHFDKYTTMDDCVTDKTVKMERAYSKNPVAAEAAANAQISRAK
jgi:hypothetical protein